MTDSQNDVNSPDDEPALNIGSDPEFLEAMTTVANYNLASISLLQRRFKISYNKAAGLIGRMEKLGYVSVRNESGSRTIIQGFNLQNYQGNTGK